MRTFCLGVALLVGGCDALGGSGVFGEACDHLAAAGNTQVAAAAFASSAPALTTNTGYDVSLPEVAGGRAGVVELVAAVRGSVVVVLTENLPVKVTGLTGDELAATSSGNIGPCSELKAWYGYDVSAGQNLITLGGPGVSATRVGLVLESETDAL